MEQSKVLSKIIVSIHAPHEGERPAQRWWLRSPFWFQSTLPTRGSDVRISSKLVRCRGFNPRSPRGGATYQQPQQYQQRTVSIHAPHEGERPAYCAPFLFSVLGFNPRSPRGGATLDYN